MQIVRPLVTALAAALLLSTLAGCSASFPGAERSAIGPQAAGEPAFDSVSEIGDSSSVSVISNPSGQVVAGQQVIHAGNATLVVDDPAVTAGELRRLATSLGGYVESETVREASEYSEASATLMLRLPSSEFDTAFDGLTQFGEVVDQDRSATDVTLEMVDLEARVEALEASVDRLTELMSGAASTAELLEAEAALSERQQELDGMRAQLEQLEHQVGYSSLWVTAQTRSPLPGGPANFWDGLVAGFDAMQTAGALALVLIGVLLPWLLLLGVIAVVVIVIVRVAVKRRRRRIAEAAGAVGGGGDGTATAAGSGGSEGGTGAS